VVTLGVVGWALGFRSREVIEKVVFCRVSFRVRDFV
jgi:hypothetical protein